MLEACGKVLWKMFSEPSLTLNRLEGGIQALYQRVQHDQGCGGRGVQPLDWSRFQKCLPSIMGFSFLNLLF